MKLTTIPAGGQHSYPRVIRSRWRPTRTGMAAAAVTIVMIAIQSVVFAAPAAAAAALSTLTYVQGNSGNSSLDSSVFLECPANQVVVGGSAIASTTTGTIARISGYWIGTTGDHGFLVALAEEDEVGSPGNWTLFATAVCAQRPAGYEVVPGETTFNSSSDQTLTVTCPAGKQLLAGFGVVQISERNVILDDIQPSMSLNAVTIKAYEDETGYSGNWNIFATAACANPVTGLTLPFASTNTDSLPKDTYLQVSCPDGKRAISFGGTINSGLGQVEPRGAFVSSNHIGFLVSEDRNGFSGNWSSTAYATCVT